jgi:hypothetical protein
MFKAWITRIFSARNVAGDDLLGEKFIVTPHEYADLMELRQGLSEASQHSPHVQVIISSERADAVIVALTAGMSILEVK